MNAEPTYEELAEIIASWLHTHMYLSEPTVDGTFVKNVNNMFSSGYQIATGVLNRLDILVPLDDEALRNDFTCTPDEFAAVAARNKDKGCQYGMLMLAMICLLTQHPDDTQLRDYLVKWGICEPGDTTEVRLTASGERYNALYSNWSELLDE